MPFTRPGPPDNTSNNGSISYNTDTIREVANDILREVAHGRDRHQHSWGKIEHYINVTCQPTYTILGGMLTLPGVPDHMRSVLQPHAERLAASYDWLEAFARSLLEASDRIDESERAIKNTFQ